MTVLQSPIVIDTLGKAAGIFLLVFVVMFMAARE